MLYNDYDSNYVKDELELIAAEIAKWNDADFGGGWLKSRASAAASAT